MSSNGTGLEATPIGHGLRYGGVGGDGIHHTGEMVPSQDNDHPVGERMVAEHTVAEHTVAEHTVDRHPIDDPTDPRLADYRSLRPPDAAPRSERDQDTVVIEGHLALLRAMEGPLRLRSVVMTPQRAGSLQSLRSAIPAGVPVYVVKRGTLRELTGFDVHRGVLASADRPEPSDPAEVLCSHRRLVFLEGLGDLENLGAVFRVAAALGFGAVLTDDRCADPLYRRCVRVSLGWSTVLPHARFTSSRAALRALHSAGVRTVALTPSPGTVPVDQAASRGLLDDPVALLVGSEGSGLTAEALEVAEHRVSIPMARGVDSLNAATALAVVASFAAAARGWS